MLKLRLAAILAVLVVGMGWAAPAQAQATRTWISGVGDDANPCSRTAPCKTFAGAISKTASGGEINVLDPGSFGAVTITKPITLSSECLEAGVQVSATNGIVVNVPNATDTVILRGLDIEGLGTGLSGVTVLTAGNVTVENCTVDQFTVSGIDFTPTVAGSQLHVANTIVRNTGFFNNGSFAGATGQGILINPSSPATATLTNVRLDHNVTGLKVQGLATVGVRDGTAANNALAGYWASSNGGLSPGANLTLERCVATHNNTLSAPAAAGIVCNAGTIVRMGNMSISDNNVAAVAAGGTCLSYQNNDIDVPLTGPAGNPIPVPPFTLPPAGVDVMQVNMVETYTINGVGTDTVSLSGTLVTSRGTPLLGPGQTTQSWDTSTVVSQFTWLNLSGTSPIFGPVQVTLDPNRPSYAAVTGGKCATATSVAISLPALGLSLTTAAAVQLQSKVKTIPPIGTQETRSVGGPTNLVDNSGRVVGTLNSAQILWRALISQTPYGGSGSASPPTLASRSGSSR